MTKALTVLLASLIAVAPALGAASAALAQPAKTTPTAPVAKPGKMLVDATGARLGLVDRVEDDGSAEVILDGHMVVVPAATLSIVNGKLTTSLKKGALL